MNRRDFCANSALGLSAVLWPRVSHAGLHPGKAALNGQERVFDPQRHYPNTAGIVDPKTKHRFFFHYHRPDEFGHFHTFSIDSYGAPVHIAMITINDAGRATSLSTTNQWVTGTRYIPADQMKPFIEGFSMGAQAHTDPALVSFITDLIHGNRANILQLYVDRDRWIERYRKDQEGDPFKDEQHEVLSSLEFNGEHP